MKLLGCQTQSCSGGQIFQLWRGRVLFNRPSGEEALKGLAAGQGSIKVRLGSKINSDTISAKVEISTSV